MDLVVILWGCGTTCGISEMVFCDEGKEEGFRLLTWRGDGAGGRTTAGDGERAVPTPGDEVAEGISRTCGTMIRAEEVALSDEVELGIGLLDWVFLKGKCCS